MGGLLPAVHSVGDRNSHSKGIDIGNNRVSL